MAEGTGVSKVTLVTVLIVLVGTLLLPAVGTTLTSGEKTEEPLQAGNTTITSDLTLHQSDFGAGTFHFSKLVVSLDRVVGTGTLSVQIGVPELRTFVLTRNFNLSVQRPASRTIVYQPSVEFHKRTVVKDVNNQETVREEGYLGRITVRVNSGEKTRIIAVKNVRVEVEW